MTISVLKFGLSFNCYRAKINPFNTEISLIFQNFKLRITIKRHTFK